MFYSKFKVCKSVHHRTIQINHQPDATIFQFIILTVKLNSNKSPTRCNNFPFCYPDVYLQLNMFRAFSRPSSGAQWLQKQPLVLPSYRGDSRAVFVVEPAGRPVGPTNATYIYIICLYISETWSQMMAVSCSFLDYYSITVIKYCVWIICHIVKALNAELNPIYHLLTLLEAHHIFHVSRIRVTLSCIKQCTLLG
jgi:hypothetical protein